MTDSEQAHIFTRQPFAVFVVLVFALMSAAAFHSGSLVTAAYDLPTNGASEGVISLAESWHTLMQSIGVADLSEQIREQIASVRTFLVLEEEF